MTPYDAWMAAIEAFDHERAEAVRLIRAKHAPAIEAARAAYMQAANVNAPWPLVSDGDDGA